MLWLILGILIGAGFIFLAHRSEFKLAWYDYIILAVSIVFLLLAIANFSGSRAELEYKAANILLLSFGVPGLILMAVVGVRAWRSYQTLTAKSAK
ncbi:MAG TPA: hypothetical protein PKD09_12150 [Aggregatilinea sp.]|uniref:dehalogenase n=1 Tax=Aggregatilinea TaxID=2806306 RepID=UPI000E5B31A8|nr:MULTISPECIES: dehalogenase [Aggregatilinea]HML22395.1 hypothetical protein [Aggregatilinea sp.]